eukprot:Blabericola_migrator_1__8046@NODE_412_length_8716_cov_285_566539_g325_i0_p3_GENE_NODE_412_length_8716_cov_285_566539_g325_i0NODE_412_length_8716_cov_285_566539_g325_i0_p3_ORF_typecomplete_len487_score58_16_NODE_412_length_8716_cov_285_566539_g325_i032984758
MVPLLGRLGGLLVLIVTTSLICRHYYYRYSPLIRYRATFQNQRELYLDGDPNWQSSNSSLDFEIIIHQAGKSWVGQHDHSQLQFQAIDAPIVCHNVLLHVCSHRYLNKMPVWIRRQQEWIKHFPEDCFFTFTERSTLPTYQQPVAMLKEIRKNLPFRSRYDVQSLLAATHLAGFLVRTGEYRDAPWIFFSDLDTLQLSKHKSLDTVLDRLERGLALPSAEERLCAAEPELFGPCPSHALRARKLDELAYVVPLDTVCYDDWMYNAGTILWRPSRLLGFIGQAILHGYNDTSQHHHFDTSDQGRMGLVLRELFDINPDKVRALCGGRPFVRERWEPSTYGDEILFVRPLHMARALKHPVYGKPTTYWFPDRRLWPNESHSVAVVNPRWFDASSCNYTDRLDLDRVNMLFMKCGDFNVHFNGCGKEQYSSKAFRRLVTETPECVEALPWKTNDANTGPFDPIEWVEDGIEMRFFDPLKEPDGLMQYGD